MTTEGKIVVAVLILILLGGGIWYTTRNISTEIKQETKDVVTPTKENPFSIDGTLIMLVDGKFETESAPDSASKIITTYFGNEVRSDLDGDDTEDQAFLVTQTTGGSGTFFYIATTLGGPALVLGDRIAPQTTEWRNGKIIVNYADRNPGEPMTAPPTQAISRYFIWSNGALAEVESATSTTAQWRETN